MRYVAFFRYVNFGKTGSPRRENLLEAFGGGDCAWNHQTNGTIVFDTTNLWGSTQRARKRLADQGFSQPVIIRPLGEIAAIVGRHEREPADSSIRIMVSFFDGVGTKQDEPPRSSVVTVRTLAPDYAVSACRQRGTSVGDATVLLERYLGCPVTSRTVGTLERLIGKYGDD